MINIKKNLVSQIIILFKLQQGNANNDMDRDIPVFNRPVMEKIFRKNQQKHLERLRSIKSGNTNRTMPIGNNHTLSNKKALLTQEIKRTQIQKQNVLLFNKMMRIMKRNDPHNQPAPGFGTRGGKTASENSRIVQENKGLFQRLEHQRPTISNKKLQQDRLKNLTILKFLGKYPNPIATRSSGDSFSSQLGRKSETRKKFESFNGRAGQNINQFELDQELYDEQIRHYKQQIQNFKDKSTELPNSRRKFMSQNVNRNNVKVDSQASQGLNKLIVPDLVNQSSQILNKKPKTRQQPKINQKSENDGQPTQFSTGHHSTKQIVLFQKICSIARNKAQVHILRLYNTYKITAKFGEPVKGKNIYDLQIPEEEGNQFFSEHNYDYNKICKMLIIEDGNLVINPNNIPDSPNMRKTKQNIHSYQSEKRENINKQQQGGNTNQQWTKYEQALQVQIQ